MEARTPKPRPSAEERARLYVSKLDPAIKGQDGHGTGFHVACVLIQGFGLSKAAALPIFEEFNARCQPPFPPAQLIHKLDGADAEPGLRTREGLKPRGCLRDAGGRDDGVGRPIENPAPVPEQAPALKRPDFSPEKLREVAGAWRDTADLRWLANRSATDPAQVTAARFLQSIYRPGEKVVCFTQQFDQGVALWPDDKVPTTGREGVWYLAQPVDGKYHPNPRSLDKKTGQPLMSRRSMESVVEFRYLVLESDKADMRDWLGLLVQIPLRIEAIYTSGGRSIHALVRVNCPTKSAFDAAKRELEPTLNLLGLAGNDPQILSSVRLTRLPGAMREGKKDKSGAYVRFNRPELQKLLYLRPNAPLRPLKDLPAVRDVEAYWCGLADLGVGDADEGTGAEWVLGGLRYYANVSARVREKMGQFKLQLENA